ncbi:MAG: hypothetical protein ACK55Z_20110, partial [bacterium]
HMEVRGTIDITVKGQPVNINFNRVNYICENVGYWRKANQIHNWFVYNVQGGEDDCREYSVSRQDFENLLESVNLVLNAKGTPEESSVIKEHLSPTEGFFFGSTQIDEWYWEDLETTKQIVSDVLAEMDEDGKNPDSWVDYYYTSSW